MNRRGFFSRALGGVAALLGVSAATKATESPPVFDYPPPGKYRIEITGVACDEHGTMTPTKTIIYSPWQVCTSEGMTPLPPCPPRSA